MHVVERLGNSTFVLRPDYDATVAKLGYEPPLGIPVECTFEWLNDWAEQKLQKQRRAAAKAAAAAPASGVIEAPKSPVRKRTPSKPPASGRRRTTPRKDAP